MPMQSSMRKFFSPILSYFEADLGAYKYKKSHRTILIVVGCLFLFLALVSVGAALVTSIMGAAIPFLVFVLVGLVCLVVGGLGTDRAVAKIWGTK